MVLSSMSKPPFSYNSRMVDRLARISLLLGKVQTRGLEVPDPFLRRSNTIKTIHSTLAIEGNTLSEEQITAIIEGKKVGGRPNEILEVQNAIRLYEKIESFNYARVNDFLKAHAVLMKGLVKEHGKFRKQNVGVLKGKKIIHAAPQPKLVPGLIGKHFDWLKKEKEVHPIIKSCVSHYEIEFIHPFGDGNGRMGRFWQTLILSHISPVFQFLPIESIIRERQDVYYQSLEFSDRQGESTRFIEFGLEILESALEEFIEKAPSHNNTRPRRLELAKKKFKRRVFSRKEYQEAVSEISTATASRDLIFWFEQGVLKKEGKRNQTKYYFGSYTDRV